MTTLQDTLVAYKTYARAEGKSPKTIIWVTSSVGYFADFLGTDHQDIGCITSNDIRRFIIALREKHRWSQHPYAKPQETRISPTAVNTYLRGVRNFFNFLVREGFVEASPMERLRIPKAPELVVPTFSEKEIGMLLAQPDKRSNQGFRDYTIMLTYYDTTARLSELVNLEESDIDYEQSQFKVMGKGSKERYVFFGRRVAKALMRYQLKCRPEPVGTTKFFLRYDGRPLSGRRVEKLISMYGRQAGLRAYPHKLRHTGAVAYLRNGGDVFSLQHKLGHSSLTMTRHYANLSNSDVRNSHLRYSPADRLSR